MQHLPGTLPPLIPLPRMHSSPLASALLSLQPVSKYSDFLRGFLLPFRCILLCWTHKKIRRHSFLAASLTLVLLLACAAAAWLLSSSLIQFLWGPHPPAWNWKFIAHTGLHLLLSLFLFLLLALSLPSLLLSPLQNKLSEITEEEFRPLPMGNSWLKTSWNGLFQTLLRISLLYGGAFAFFTLSFLPAIGFAFGILGILWAATWLGVEYASIPLMRNNAPFLAGLRLLGQRKMLFWGFGLGTHVLLWLPIVQLFLLPGATVGGTLLYLAVQNEFSNPKNLSPIK